MHMDFAGVYTSLTHQSSRDCAFSPLRQTGLCDDDVAPNNVRSAGQGVQRDGFVGDIIQFSCPSYYAEVTEGEASIDIMRLGSMKGSISVSYKTVDGSAQSGDHFVAAAGCVTFADGQCRVSIKVQMIEDDDWDPTLSFKVKLFDPQNCCLEDGRNFCRVSIIDHQLFPSSKYEAEIAKGEDGISNIPGLALFYEYFKLNFNCPGMMWRTCLILVLDQMKNIYLYMTLRLSLELVDETFATTGPDTPEKHIATMEKRAFVVGLLYILPMIGLHMWDDWKIRLDVSGRSCAFLQRSLIRIYLNYTEVSRLKVRDSAMQTAIVQDTADVAEGYTATLEILQMLGKLAVLTVFMLMENPGGFIWIIVMPLIMFGFGYIRHSVLSAVSDGVGSRASDVLELANETCRKYQIVSDYKQRHQFNELFWLRSEELRTSKITEKRVKNNNNYCPKWLGPLFVGFYIIGDARSVLNGSLNLGVLLATISIFQTVGSDFGEVYKLVMQLSATFDTLRGITVYFNYPTELAQWKAINRARRARTKEARDLILSSHRSGPESPKFLTDEIPIKVINMSFAYPAGDGDAADKLVVKGVNLEVPQGKLIALVGPQGAGRKTFLRLMAHALFPTEGEIFVPTHLTTLHVSQEPVMLNLSPLRNLAFGVTLFEQGEAKVNVIDRIKQILVELKMQATLDLVEQELRDSPPSQSCKVTVEDHPPGADEDEDDTREKTHDFKWWLAMTHTQLAKIHLARALIMNPELLVMNRPLSHYESSQSGEAKTILELLKLHVVNRGLCLPGGDARVNRRPRTLIFSPDAPEQAKTADVIWQIEGAPVNGIASTVVETTFENVGDGMHRRSSSLPKKIPPGSARPRAPPTRGGA